jgi:hypothetical protein
MLARLGGYSFGARRGVGKTRKKSEGKRRE